MSSIEQQQHQLIEEFKTLQQDREMMLYYLMELGETLPPLEQCEKIPENNIEGCIASVWLVYKIEEGKLFFKADSNTSITKGMISLLIKILSGQPAKEIAHANLFFIEAIGLNQLLGSQRMNGLIHMVSRLKHIAFENL